MKIVFLSLFLIVATGCQSTITPPKGFVKVEKSSERAGSLGFAFMTPKGENWFQGFSDKTLMYLKITDSSKLSFFAGATEVPFDSKSKSDKALLDYIYSYKNDWGGNLDRYKNVQIELDLIKSLGVTCVKYKQTGEDHNAKNLGNNKFLVLTNVGRVCLQPTSKNMLVDIYYSSRALPGLDINSYTQEGEYFINSLVYKG